MTYSPSTSSGLTHTNITAPYSAPDEIVRIDFIQTADGLRVTKLTKRDGYPIPHSSELKPAGFDLAGALAWCEQNGWTVRRWPTGARAWKYGLEPVRNRAAILRLREDIRRYPRPELDGQGWVLDLQYDL